MRDEEGPVNPINASSPGGNRVRCWRQERAGKGQKMDFKISGEQRLMIASVRDLVEAEFKPNALKYMDGTFPWPNLKKLAELGVLGMSVPQEYGGLGLSIFDSALILEEIAKGCYVTAMATLGEAGVQTPVDLRFRAHPRGNRQGLLRHGDGDAR
jgi:hypothetical protein